MSSAVDSLFNFFANMVGSSTYRGKKQQYETSGQTQEDLTNSKFAPYYTATGDKGVQSPAVNALMAGVKNTPTYDPWQISEVRTGEQFPNMKPGHYEDAKKKLQKQTGAWQDLFY